MEAHRRSLYKEHKEVLTAHQHSRLNRQLQESNREKRRIEQFQRSRNISPSPTRHKIQENEALVDKENIGSKGNSRCSMTKEEKSRTAKLICTARDPAKIKKQESYILRFLEWKDKKKAQQEKQKTQAVKKRPFVSAVCKDTNSFKGAISLGTKSVPAENHQQQPSFVPKGHNKFNPPPGLSLPGEMLREKVKSRQSVYMAVATPPKSANESQLSKFPIARKALPTNLHGISYHTKHRTPARTNGEVVAHHNNNHKFHCSGSKPKATTATAINSNAAAKPPTTAKSNNVIKTFNKVNSVDKTKGTAATTNANSNAVLKLKPRSLKMPPPPTMPVKRPAPPSRRIRKSVESTQTNTQNAAKFKSAATVRRLESKRANEKKSPQQPRKNARLTQTMKAKKPVKTTNGPTSSKLLTLMMTQTNDMVADMVVQTPRDFTNCNHFDDFVTSTKLKDTSQTLEQAKGISPIETMPQKKRSSANTSAKRNLLKDATMKNAQAQLLAGSGGKNKGLFDVIEQPNAATRKYNFIRYSEINTTLNDDEVQHDLPDANDKEECQEEKLPTPSPAKDNDHILLAENLPIEEKTPTKALPAADANDTPVNYLSPYVSVSRGKVSLKKEKEKRNSIYLVSPTGGVEELNVSVHNSTAAVASPPNTAQYSIEVRRTLEAVRYYRKQLHDETDRLHKQCDIWEAYKEANLELLQTANVDDMIDVTVGQTRLLTSKKFMQFKGLIDRCESGATGIDHKPYDGSENTKLINSTDLEGFWSMLGLQVDNLEKRFENLNRWKANNWQDPDEDTKPKAVKPKKNLTKVKKKAAAVPTAKAKPTSALQQMLRKMQAEMRSKKANDMLTNAAAEDVVLTPSKVRDRKYFSPAATVVGIPTSGNRRLSLLARTNSQDSPNRRMSIGGGRRNSHESPRRLTTLSTNAASPAPAKRATLHETVMRANAEAQAFTSPQIKGRKSILKTPGSARTNLKNVLFNDKLRVKRFNFVINDGEDLDDEECNKSTEEDMRPNSKESDHDDESDSASAVGTYSLRNRKVRLRPSCEIIIPR